jgi:hypothetical protein
VSLDCKVGVRVNVHLVVEMPEEEIAPSSGRGRQAYREFLTPAEVANRYGPPRVRDSKWVTCTNEGLLQAIHFYERIGTHHALQEAGDIKNLLPFQTKYGLLEQPDETEVR